MRIEQISIKNFKMFKDVVVGNVSSKPPRPLPQLAVLMGANGAGKTTFFDVFGFLSHCLRENVSAALGQRGGFKEVLSRGCDPSKDSISFEIKFRNTEIDRKKQPLITYEVIIAEEKGRAVVAKEVLQYRRGQYGAPWKFLQFEYGKGSAIKNEQDYDSKNAQEQRDEQTLSSPDILAIKGLGQFEKFQAISSFRKLLEGWYVANLKIDAARTLNDVGYSPHLNQDGSNLPQVTQHIFQYYPEIFATILKKMASRVPGIEEVSALSNEAGQIMLKFKDGSFKDPFISKWVSDGTLKMFAYLVLLHDPAPHPLLCIEEPENYLYPELLPPLAEELRDYAQRGGQVFVSTHSPDFVNALEIDELLYVVKERGFSEVKFAEDNDVAKKLFKEGDKLGFLWQRGYFRIDGLR